ncbi:energy transducer TonB [Halanaerobium hydrogeniformans]|uniref:TonB family protein n=1 Tax=Halanaerobium hydrogeniformans TaxID=656519 RepID=E4RL19_HALHG|nr:energy transducer TonB [Halanaerobium hydrogeniformans]ADQ14783.1 TonB family protein [Halanaerobium hydrogeniformans]
MKKEDKFVFVLSFILSLSMLFLLEACPFRLLANDIQVVEREEVEIELLLSDAAELFEEEGGSEAAEDSDSALEEEIAQEDSTSEAEVSEEVEPEPDRETETQYEETEEELAEEPEEVEERPEIEEEPEEEIEEVEEKPEVEEVVEIEEEIEEEPEELEEVEVVEEAEVEVEEELNESEEEQLPEWVLNQNEVEEPEESEDDSFDLDSYLAELRNNNDDADDEENEVVDEIVNRESEEVESSQPAEEQIENGGSDDTDSGEDEIYDLRENGHSGIDRPSIRNHRAPEYPPQMRRRNIEGRVILSLKIDQDGKTSEFEIHDSSGYDAFDQAALSAVKEWEFEAAKLDDQFVSVRITLPIRFELD